MKRREIKNGKRKEKKKRERKTEKTENEKQKMKKKTDNLSKCIQMQHSAMFGQFLTTPAAQIT
ncbi:hypothetical protein AGE06_23580 [Salmonella enterica subsp. enterica serovar Kentucky]|nr:hypothetical protein AGE06_23580 [Salmonella enterica subsp. enterica serovar Kentucky]